jgi:hypothetical protein
MQPFCSYQYPTAGLVEEIKVSTLQFQFYNQLVLGAHIDSRAPCDDSATPQAAAANCFGNRSSPYEICTLPY